jgi:hypothetical protein
MWHLTLIDFHSKKIPSWFFFLVLKSFAYFDDADEQEIPFMFHNTPGVQLKIILKKHWLIIN